MREQLLFVVLPYLATIAWLVVPLVRGLRGPSIQAARTRGGRSFGLEGSRAWRWGVILLVVCHLVGFLLPRLIAWVGRLHAGTVIEEGLGLAFAGLAVGGLVAWTLEGVRIRRERRSAQAVRRASLLEDGSIAIPRTPLAAPREDPAKTGRHLPQGFLDRLLLLLVLLALGSGLVVGLRYRWATAWYADTILPYLRSLVRLQPALDLMIELPLAVRLHTVAGFLAAALFPFTDAGRTLALPWSGLHRRMHRTRRGLRRVPDRRLGWGLRIGLAATALALLGAGLFTADALHRIGSSQGYAPVQPIAFSHQLHAGVRQIPCLYCHFGAERSRHAGIPPLNVCMNCHSQIRLASAELQKLKEAVAQNRPVRWIKIHNLPDFVYFNHSQHVTVAGLACQRCHGAVETMQRVEQKAPLTMGWCIGCHRSEGVVPPEQHRFELVANSTPRPVGRGMGGQDCSKCHY